MRLPWFRWARDPRYAVAAFLTLFSLLGQMHLRFFQDWRAVAAALASAVVAELVLGRWLRGRWPNPVSAYISGTSLGILLVSPHVWPYALAGFAAIASKYVLRLDGRHVFNPSNFGLVALILLFPDAAVVTPKQWSQSLLTVAVIGVLGLLTVARARRHDTVISFVLAFAGFALARHLLFAQPLLYALGPLLGASLQLFMFFMITDPSTTPPTRAGRVAVACGLALLDAILRVGAVNNSQFIAAFLLTPLVRLLAAYRSRRARVRVATGEVLNV